MLVAEKRRLRVTSVSSACSSRPVQPASGQRQASTDPISCETCRSYGFALTRLVSYNLLAPIMMEPLCSIQDKPRLRNSSFQDVRKISPRFSGQHIVVWGSHVIISGRQGDPCEHLIAEIPNFAIQMEAPGQPEPTGSNQQFSERSGGGRNGWSGRVGSGRAGSRQKWESATDPRKKIVLIPKSAGAKCTH